MDVSNSAVSALSSSGIYAAKKASEIQAASVTQLLNSVTASASGEPQYNNPPQLGNSIDIKV